ncbi:unnamed protein product, partial [Closterium sp. NIES-53]
LGGRARVVLTGHADASWSDDLTTQRSSQGYTFRLGSGSVSSRSTRSSSVLSSSCEAEIYAGAIAAQELRWLAYLPTDLGEPPRSPLVLYHLLAAETSAVAVGAARGTLRPPFFEGCPPSPLAPSYASATATDVSVAEDVGAASTSAKRRSSKGEGGRGGGGGSGGGGGGSGSGGGGSSGGGGGNGGGGGGGTGGGSGGFGGGGGGNGGSGGSGGGGTGGGRTGPRRGGPGGGQRQQQRRSEAQSPQQLLAIFDLDYDDILSAMCALSASAEGDCYRCVPPDPGIAAAALGASESGTLPGTAPAEALPPSRWTQAPRSVSFVIAPPSLLSLHLSRSDWLTPPGVPTGSHFGLHLPSFSTNLVSNAALQDAMVTTTTPGGQRVSICTCTWTGHHLATFTRRPGSSLYTLATEPPQVAASAQVSASGQVAASCSCRLLSHQTLLLHHRLGHPSLPHLRGMHSCLLVSGLPRSLPPLPPSPAPSCLPCVKGRERAAPHSSSFPLTIAPLQTLHMDMWIFRGIDYFQNFSPTPKMTTLRVLLHVAAQRDYELHSLDFSTAFLRGSLHEESWLRRPPGFTGSFPAGTQWSLRRPVYGLRQAPCEWHDTLRTTLAALGFAPSTLDPSLFLRTDTSLSPFYVLIYIDDLVFATANTKALTLVNSEMQKRNTYTDMGPSALQLPVLLATAHSSVCQPVALSSTFGRVRTQSLHRKVHWYAAKRVLRYLCSTSGMGLVLGGRGPVVLIGHADASWVDDSATRRLSQGYTFSLGSGSVSWRSTRSSSVLSSSCEAEIYAGAMAAQELRWLTYLLTDLGEQPRSPPVLYVDNKTMIALCQEHRLEHRTKHIALRYFLARELQQRGQLRLAYVATRANTADILTKALLPGDHQRFSTVLGLLALLFLTGLVTTCSPPFCLWGVFVSSPSGSRFGMKMMEPR